MKNIKARLQKPIVMIGLMGAGKTKIGGLLARALGLPFVDADAAIEQAAGCTIPEMFERRGEAAFRALERDTIARLLSEELRVIATGGGAVMNDQTAALIWSNGLSVWLRADLDLLVERTGRNDNRPLLRNGDPREILGGLMDKRYPVYEKADIAVDSSPAAPEETLDKLLKALAAHVGAEDHTA